MRTGVLAGLPVLVGEPFFSCEGTGASASAGGDDIAGCWRQIVELDVAVRARSVFYC